MNKAEWMRGGQQDPVKAAARTLDLLEAFAEAGGRGRSKRAADIRADPSCHGLIRTPQKRGDIQVLAMFRCQRDSFA